MSSDITFVDTFLCNSIKESKESLCDKFINGPLHRPHAPDPSMHYGWNRLQIKANFSCVLQVLCLPGKTVWNIRIWQIYSSFIWIDAIYYIIIYLHIVNKLFDIKMNYDSQVEVELDNISYQLLAEMTYVRPFFFNFTVVYILRRTFSTRNSTLGIIL